MIKGRSAPCCVYSLLRSPLEHRQGQTRGTGSNKIALKTENGKNTLIFYQRLLLGLSTEWLRFSYVQTPLTLKEKYANAVSFLLYSDIKCLTLSSL